MPRPNHADRFPPSDLLKSGEAEDMLIVSRTVLQRAREHMLVFRLPRVQSDKVEQVTNHFPRLYTKAAAEYVADNTLNTPLDQIRKLSKSELALPLINYERERLAKRIGNLVVSGNLVPIVPLAHTINVVPNNFDRWSAGGAIEKVRRGRESFIPIEEMEKFEWRLPLALRDEPDHTQLRSVL